MKMRGTRLFCLTLFIFALGLAPSFAADPTNYVPNSFESSLFSGYFGYNYKINLPPGINGLTPNVSLSYNSHAARNSNVGWAGAGWEVPLSYIQRNINGTVTNISDDTFDLIMDASRSNLVYTASDSLYHTKVESYLKVEKKTGMSPACTGETQVAASNTLGEYWTVTAKDGTEYRFGYHADSENLINNASVITPYVWRYSLDRIRDTNGNCIYFTYTENPTPNDQGAVYLSRIEYNSDKKRTIDFVLEDSDRPDMISVVDQGSTVKLARRLSQINVSVSGQPVKSFGLSYSMNAAQSRSLLSTITKIGSDGSALPPAIFQYSSMSDANTLQADLLAQVVNELGGTTSIAYVSSFGLTNTVLPFNYWLVSAVTNDNGMLPVSSPHHTSATTQYAYQNGYYDLTTDEFRGFQNMTETRADSSKALHTFMQGKIVAGPQDEATKGKEARVELDDSLGNPYSATANLWSAEASTASGVYIARLDETDSYTYDGTASNPKVVTTLYQNYDNYGNPWLVIDEGDTSVTGDETYVYNEYVYNPSLWIVGKPMHSYTSSAPCTSSSACSTKLRESWFYYDRAFSWQNQLPFAGNLTQREDWNNSGANPISTYYYDLSGNVIKKTDPLDHWTQIDYDDNFNTFPVSTTNGKDQTSLKNFNAANGQPLMEVDPNGFYTTYGYDAFNRLSFVVKPYDSSNSPTTQIQYIINAAPPHAVITKSRETSGGGTYDTIRIIDGFGRLIQIKSEYQDSSGMVTADSFYDSMGRLASQSNPYLGANTYSYSPPDINNLAPATTNTYDALGRVIKTTNPDNTIKTTVYDHWKTIGTDENGHSKTQVFNAYNKLVQVIEWNGVDCSANVSDPGCYVTNYNYDVLGELLQTADDYGNTSTRLYDSLGRLTTMNDVDMGQKIYSYDLAGNMLSQTDARGIVTTFQYDALDRNILIHFQNDKDIEFVYDLDTIGVLSQATDSLGTATFKYDQRLRKIQEDRTMDGMTWTTKWDYDAMDRAVKMTYPDGEVVQFTYNTQDKLQKLQRTENGNTYDIISNLSYDPAGHTLQKNYANGRVTTYSHDPLNQRLTGISTPGSPILQNFAYSYDNAGNIQTIVDSAASPVKTETYTYDALNRLINAHDDLPTNGYDTTQSYDAIGNLLAELDNKTGAITQYTYGQGTANPHAVTGKTDSLPIIGSFVLDNGNAYTTKQQITLNNISIGVAATDYYMASEDPNFVGASWQPYETAPTYPLTNLPIGFEASKTITVYFKVKNANGESQVKSSSIQWLSDANGDGIPDINDKFSQWEVQYGLNPFDPTVATQHPAGDKLTYLQKFQYGLDPNKIDTDGDGLSDYDEIFVYHTNPLKVDSDGDGLTDYQEVMIYHTDPNNPYNDSVSENYSIKRWGFNAGGGSRHGVTYAVNDKVGSGFSKIVSGIDSDGDGIPDWWDEKYGFDPTDPTNALRDSDGDGLTNLQEYLYGTNPNKADSDNDGLTDYQEIFIYHTDPNNPDTDGDGLIDSVDPNPLVPTWHYALSENYSVRNSSFNSGGFTIRTGTSYNVSDRLGDELSGQVLNIPYSTSLSITPPYYDFGKSQIGNSYTTTLTFQNNGIQNMIMGVITLTGMDSAEFAIQKDECSGNVLSPSVSCTVQVAFNPESPGGRGTILNVQYNDADVKQASVSLSGIAFASCSYALAPLTQVLGFAGGNETFNVTVGNSCIWTASTSDNWLEIASGSGNGNGQVQYSVATNTSSTSRNGAITVGGKQVTVTQAGTTCSYSISPTGGYTFDASGGTGNVNVTASTGCDWTVQSDQAWINVLSGSGSGSGTMTYSVSLNPGSGRTGAVIVAGQTHSVNQTGVVDPTCLNSPVRRLNSSSWYYSLQEAYDGAFSGDIIQSQVLDYIENLVFDRNISVTIKGGYDCNYSTNSQSSAVDGNMTISNGTVIIDNLILQ